MTGYIAVTLGADLGRSPRSKSLALPQNSLALTCPALFLAVLAWHQLLFVWQAWLDPGTLPASSSAQSSRPLLAAGLALVSGYSPEHWPAGQQHYQPQLRCRVQMDPISSQI